jgi:hypothetical protein
MSKAARRAALALVSCSALLSVAWALDGCGSDSTSDTAGKDASVLQEDGGSGSTSDSGMPVATDAGSSTPTDSGGGGTKDSGGGGSCSQGIVVHDAGETCVGFGPADPCNQACGLYGYRCFGGAPPGFTGCLQLNASAILGETYCCPKDDCVAEPDQDKTCAAVGGKPHRYQCPPNDAGFATPPAGCVDAGATSVLEHFFCCP